MSGLTGFSLCTTELLYQTSCLVDTQVKAANLQRKIRISKYAVKLRLPAGFFSIPVPAGLVRVRVPVPNFRYSLQLDDSCLHYNT